jgi:hypothetical protein
MTTHTTPASPSARAIDPAAGEITYRYRPRMVGAEFVFRLEADALAWDAGRRNGRLAYRDVARLRLGYRPANLAASRFIAEIWSRQGAKLEITSITQRSLFDYQSLAAEYRAFVIELARRVGASGGGCRFDAGFPPWRWWPALFVGVATLAAAFYVFMRALMTGEIALGVIIAAFGFLFLWQMGSMIMRNRPRSYDPNSIPGDVLP